MQASDIGDLLDQYNGLDIKRLTRSELGPLGTPSLAAVVAQLKSELISIRQYWDQASSNRVLAALKAYRDYLGILYEYQSASDQVYPNLRQEKGYALISAWDQTREVWPYFGAVAISKSGLFESAATALEQIDDKTRQAETRVRTIAENMLKEAQAHADYLETKVRDSAKGFSVKSAQDQFNEAARSLNRRAALWGIAALGFTTLFLAFAFWIYLHPPYALSSASQNDKKLELIYLLAIRVTILTAIGAIASFCLKLFRAHLHMSAFNDHRRRVSNSMAAFVESAETPEQRDQIFARLIDSVIIFGDSGLLDKGSGELSTPAIAIDAISKNLSTKG